MPDPKTGELRGTRNIKRLAKISQTKQDEEIARSLELGLEAAPSIKDRSISLFSRGHQPAFAGINTFMKAPYCEDIRKVGEVVIVDLKGKLTIGLGDQILRETIDELLADNWKRLLLNLSEVSFMDSAGVGELVEGMRTAKRLGAELKLLNLSERVHSTLYMARLLPIFEIAYGTKLDPEIQAANIAVLSDAARNSYLAISHRRLFVKALVTEWYRQKEEGEQVLDPEYAAAAIRGQGEALMALADARQSPY